MITPETKPVASVPWWFSTRFFVAVLLSGGYLCIEMVQATIGMAIVCMVNSTLFMKDDGANRNDLICSATGEVANSDVDYGGTLQWPDTVQGMVLSGFQYGVFIAPFTGWLCDKLSPKWMLAFSVFLTSVAGFSIPQLASVSFVFTIIARALMGVGEAILIPAINCLLTTWFPQKERNSAISISVGGRQIGTLIILPLAGFFCARKDILGGWPAMFYVAAMLGMVWTVLWLMFGSNGPDDFRWCISKKEKVYLSSVLNTDEDKMDGDRKPKLIPWRKLLTSTSVWASMIAVICQEYPQITIALFLPSYLHDVFFYSSTSNGILSALPPLCFWITRISAATAADVLQKRFDISKTTLAKICNSLGAFGVGFFMAATVLLTCADANIAVALLCLSLACSGFHSAGCLGTLVSVAPPYSGTITGITYFIIAATGVVNPLLTTAIVNTGAKWQWNVVFLVNTVVSFIPLIVFNIWGSAKEEPWATKDAENTKVSTHVTATGHRPSGPFVYRRPDSSFATSEEGGAPRAATGQSHSVGYAYHRSYSNAAKGHI